MIQVPMKTAEPLNKQTVLSINQKKIQGSLTSQSIHSINSGGHSGTKASHGTGSAGSSSASQSRSSTAFPQSQRSAASRSQPAASQPQRSASSQSQPAASQSQRSAASQSQSAASQSQRSAAVLQNAAAQPAAQKPVPALIHTMRKGEKRPLSSAGTLSKIKACLGWNVTNNSCDVDVSAFLLNESGRVLGDDWFVFYGQEISPDGSTVFSAESNGDRETISVDFHKLNSRVQKIVFVLTINEALEKRLNFSMLKDAYIRIIDQNSGLELVSFQMDEYYSNVTSMMIGEIYKHKDIWKFNAIGNGVAKDLAGLCALYGVMVI